MNQMMTAEEAVRKYDQEQKNIRMMRWLTLAVFLGVLWLLRDKMNISMAAIIVAVLFVGMQFLRSMQAQQFGVLQRVLHYDCDATKYAAIMAQLAERPGKESATFKLCLARGLYYSGRFEEALEALETFYMEKPSAGTAALFHSTAFFCHAELDDLEKAYGVRQDMERLLNSIHPKQRGSVQQYLWMMDAILAWKEDRYEDFLLLQKQVAERAVTPL